MFSTASAPRMLTAAPVSTRLWARARRYIAEVISATLAAALTGQSSSMLTREISGAKRPPLSTMELSF